MVLTWAEFEKVDMRLGVVVDAKDFPEARRPAYRLLIDFSPLGVKRASAQVTTHYRPEGLIGRHVIAVVNFPPKLTVRSRSARKSDSRCEGLRRRNRPRCVDPR